MATLFSRFRAPRLLLSLWDLLGADRVFLLLVCGCRLSLFLRSLLARGFRRFVTHTRTLRRKRKSDKVLVKDTRRESLTPGSEISWPFDVPSCIAVASLLLPVRAIAVRELFNKLLRNRNTGTTNIESPP